MLNYSVAQFTKFLILYNIAKDKQRNPWLLSLNLILYCNVVSTQQTIFPLPYLITGFLYAKLPDIEQFCEMLWDYKI